MATGVSCRLESASSRGVRRGRWCELYLLASDVVIKHAHAAEGRRDKRGEQPIH